MGPWTCLSAVSISFINQDWAKHWIPKWSRSSITCDPKSFFDSCHWHFRSSELLNWLLLGPVAWADPSWQAAP